MLMSVCPAQTCLEHSIFIILGQIFKQLSKGPQRVFNVSSRGRSLKYFVLLKEKKKNALNFLTYLPPTATLRRSTFAPH